MTDPVRNVSHAFVTLFAEAYVARAEQKGHKA